ncbi:MAG: RHS repeat-associated core domain-containing protein [Terriglobales bacterium]
MSGANYQNCSSLAFGDAQTCTGSPWYALQFTGHQHDNESNLENTWFRQYNSAQGRWITPDPAGIAAVDPTNPQTWNRYAYVGNNPLNATDPSGLDAFDGSQIPSDCFYNLSACLDIPAAYEYCVFIGLCSPNNSGSGGGGAGPSPRLIRVSSPTVSDPTPSLSHYKVLGLRMVHDNR